MNPMMQNPYDMNQQFNQVPMNAGMNPMGF